MPDFKDLIRLYHWSSQPDLKTLDPKYYGTGIPGQEAARVTNQGAPQRSYFYTSDRPPEPGLGQNRYFADVPRSDLYDLSGDPEGIAADLRGQFTNAPDAQINPGVFNEAEHATAVEKALMERGYRGYIGANESAALFDPQDVTPVGLYGDQYPPVGPPELAQDKRSGKEFLSKVQSPEEQRLAAARGEANKAIKAGDYDPMFRIEDRYYADPTPYDIQGDTLTDAMPKKPETIEKWRAKLATPEATERLREGYKRGQDLGDAEKWYAMGQWQDKYIELLGEEEGAQRFMSDFAEAMAATTGGADPGANLAMATYGNYLRERGLPMPAGAYEMPHPIGGRYATGNMKLYDKFLGQGEEMTAAGNPKRFNFRNNFLGDLDRATIDEQMSKGMFDMNAPPTNAYGVAEGVVVDEAARLGIPAAEVQDVAWAGFKGVQGKPMMQWLNEAIARTSRVTGESQEDVVKSVILKRGPLYGLVGTAMAAQMTPQEAEAGIMSTLSGYSDEALRWMRQEALDEGKADEAANYAKELTRRSEQGLEGPAPGSLSPGSTAGAAGGMGLMAALQSEEGQAAPMGTLADKLRMATREAFHGTPHEFKPVVRARNKNTGEEVVLPRENMMGDTSSWEIVEEYPEGKFDLGKMGTGEGAQAYGYGAYLSSSEGIAKGYRDALSYMSIVGKDTGADAEYGDLIADAQRYLAKDPDMTSSRMQMLAENQVASMLADKDPAGNSGAAVRLNEYMKSKYELRRQGHLYTAEIPAEDHLLDWDKPPSEQSEWVQAKLDHLKEDRVMTIGDLGSLPQAEQDRIIANIKAGKPPPTTRAWPAGMNRGQDLYRALVPRDTRIVDNPDRMASEKLRELGIPGHTYKGRTSDERNYVMYDDDMINIVNRGQVDPKLLPGLAVGGAAGAYGVGQVSGQSDDFRERVAEFRARRDKKRNAGKDYMHAIAQTVGDVGSALIGPSITGIVNLQLQRQGLLTGDRLSMADADANRSIFDYDPQGNPLTEKWREDAKQWVGNFIRQVSQQTAPQQAIQLAQQYDLGSIVEAMGDKYNELPEDVRVYLESVMDATDLAL